MEYGTVTIRVVYPTTEDGKYDAKLQGDGDEVRVIMVQFLSRMQPEPQ